MSPLSDSKHRIVALALIFFSGGSLLCAQEQSATAISQHVKDIFARAAKAVVKIHGADEHSEICGTGFFIDPTGTLYTAYTVGGEAGNFTIEFGGKKYPARQLLADIRSGTAMLKVEETTPALPVGKSEEVEVVGIVVSSLENESACYAVPIEAAEKIRSDFVRFGEARHGWVGINVSEAAQPVEGSRAEMTQIMEETPAARSGIKSGDILLQVGQKKVTQPEDVLDASFFVTAGDTVPITVMRGNQKLTFHVQATLHPASRTGPLLASPATPAGNQAIPLSLSSEVPRTP